VRLGGARGLRRAEQGLPGLPEVAEARLTDVVDHPAVAAHVALRAPGAHGHRMVVAVEAPRHALGADGLAPGVQVEVPTALVAALAAAGRSSLEGALDRVDGPGGSVGEGFGRRHRLLSVLNPLRTLSNKNRQRRPVK